MGPAKLALNRAKYLLFPRFLQNFQSGKGRSGKRLLNIDDVAAAAASLLACHVSLFGNLWDGKAVDHNEENFEMLKKGGCVIS